MNEKLKDVIQHQKNEFERLKSEKQKLQQFDYSDLNEIVNVESQKRIKQKLTISDGKRFDHFKYNIHSRLLLFSYFFTKILYLLIAVLQIYLMNIFLSNEKNTFYGGQILRSIISGDADIIENHLDSRVFPRITGCDFNIRELGTSHTHTVQCILSLNLFYERIYVFLWFWVFFIIIPFTVNDIILWTMRIFFMNRAYMYKFVKRRIKIFNNVFTKHEKYMLKLFSEYYIGADGVFVLRLIERNSNAGVVAELLSQMWHEFLNEDFQSLH